MENSVLSYTVINKEEKYKNISFLIGAHNLFNLMFKDVCFILKGKLEQEANISDYSVVNFTYRNMLLMLEDSTKIEKLDEDKYRITTSDGVFTGEIKVKVGIHILRESDYLTEWFAEDNKTFIMYDLKKVHKTLLSYTTSEYLAIVWDCLDIFNILQKGGLGFDYYSDSDVSHRDFLNYLETFIMSNSDENHVLLYLNKDNKIHIVLNDYENEFFVEYVTKNAVVDSILDGNSSSLTTWGTTGVGFYIHDTITRGVKLLKELNLKLASYLTLNIEVTSLENCDVIYRSSYPIEYLAHLLEITKFVSDGEVLVLESTNPDANLLYNLSLEVDSTTVFAYKLPFTIKGLDTTLKAFSDNRVVKVSDLYNESSYFGYINSLSVVMIHSNINSQLGRLMKSKLINKLELYKLNTEQGLRTLEYKYLKGDEFKKGHRSKDLSDYVLCLAYSGDTQKTKGLLYSDGFYYQLDVYLSDYVDSEMYNAVYFHNRINSCKALNLTTT